MKKLVRILTIVALLTATACTTDEEETIAKTAPQVAGQYEGTMAASVSGREVGSNEATVGLVAEGANSVKVTLPDFEYQGHNTLEGGTVAGVSVTKSEGGYSLMKVIRSASRNDTLRGTVANDSLHMTYTTQPGTMPMPILFTFSGKRGE